MEETATNKFDMSAFAFDKAKELGFGADEAKFKDWEKAVVKKIYEIMGLSDIPDEFLTISKFVDAYSGVLVKSVQNDIAIMQLTKRLAMFKLTGSIQSTSDKSTPDAVPEDANGGKPDGFDPLAK